MSHDLKVVAIIIMGMAIVIEVLPRALARGKRPIFDAVPDVLALHHIDDIFGDVGGVIAYPF